MTYKSQTANRFAALRKTYRHTMAIGMVGQTLTPEGALVAYRPNEGREVWEGTKFLVEYPVVRITEYEV